MTWSPMHFPAAGQTVDRTVGVQASWPGGGGVLLARAVRASVGFYAWHIPADFLAEGEHGEGPLNVTLALVRAETDTAADNDFTTLTGPTVWVVRGPPPSSDDDSPFHGGRGGPGVMAVAVPILIVVAIVLGLAGACFWSWRRRGTVPIVGALLLRGRRPTRAGYGERKSWSERVRSKSGMGADFGAGMGMGVTRPDKTQPGVGDIQLTDRESWSPTARDGGAERNVFREELQRQERER